ncbi:hypothetical protein GPECTOR_90g525 [Gonium pectorale]|uniref:Uncharacterized protein n=1 Tax=Gonium pectorale TaxID=33097 RepID=A0A150G0S7_GONPE|nr:hypothetical protein GPECTOR_90g525 [Gonium pectorale]|eukprot:KXZ43438.1 hypothetical protein GPECTOR_90g525 [Gonium pectorale]
MPARFRVAPHFEAAKAVENDAALDRQLQPPSGPRSAARKTLEQEWERREREAQERGPPPAMAGPRALHLRTSSQHPLSGGAVACGGARGSAGAEEDALWTSKRVYHPGQLPPSQRPHLVGAGAQPLSSDDGGEGEAGDGDWEGSAGSGSEDGEGQAQGGSGPSERGGAGSGAAHGGRRREERPCSARERRRRAEQAEQRQVLLKMRSEGGRAAQLVDALRLEAASGGGA